MTVSALSCLFVKPLPLWYICDKQPLRPSTADELRWNWLLIQSAHIPALQSTRTDVQVLPNAAQRTYKSSQTRNGAATRSLLRFPKTTIQDAGRFSSVPDRGGAPNFSSNPTVPLSLVCRSLVFFASVLQSCCIVMHENNLRVNY